MFQLSDEKFADLKSHSVISSSWGGRRTRPYAFDTSLPVESGKVLSGNAFRDQVAGTHDTFLLQEIKNLLSL